MGIVNPIIQLPYHLSKLTTVNFPSTYGHGGASSYLRRPNKHVVWLERKSKDLFWDTLEPCVT